LLSAASLWEICTKVRSGKLKFARPAEWLNKAMRDLKLTVLPVRGNHTLRILSLPDHHEDPFDRLLVAQAQEEDAAIATSDEKIAQYPVEIFW